MREWRYGFTILDLSTRWRQVVSFMPQLLYIKYIITILLSTASLWLNILENGKRRTIICRVVMDS
jgi:hypothetical protein